MREMVLNHASLRVDDQQHDKIAGWLLGLARGMAHLVEQRVVQSSLRMVRSSHEIYCTENYSLFDAFLDLRPGGHRDEFLFFVQLTSKLPLLQDVAPKLKEQFLGCESLTPPHEDGQPLLLCAIADWVAISFPSRQDWDSGRLTVRFMELRPDEKLVETVDEIDNIATPRHAREVAEQHQRRLLAGSDPVELWENRHAAFPYLVFGPGVEENLQSAAGLFSVIVRKLMLISQSADEWAHGEVAMPNWKTKVTRESASVRNNPVRLAARRFPSQAGGTRIFEWHARYGNNGRIHLDFDTTTREVEIGYIGPHLPL